MNATRYAIVTILLVSSCSQASPSPRPSASAQEKVATPSGARPRPTSERDLPATALPALDAGDVSWAVVHDERAVEELRSGFRRCYKLGPQAPGFIRIRTYAGPNGDVEEATAIELKGLSPEIVDCLVEIVRTGSFAPSGGKGHTVNIPISFKPGSAPSSAP